MQRPVISLAYIPPIAVNALLMQKEFKEYISCKTQHMSCTQGGVLLVSYITILTSLWCLILDPPSTGLVAATVNLTTLMLLFISWKYKEPLSEIEGVSS